LRESSGASARFSGSRSVGSMRDDCVPMCHKFNLRLRAAGACAPPHRPNLGGNFRISVTAARADARQRAHEKRTFTGE
jgi:hypothetical protein